MRLIYKDKYSQMYNNMSDSQVGWGVRKGGVLREERRGVEGGKE